MAGMSKECRVFDPTGDFQGKQIATLKLFGRLNPD